MKRCCVNCFKDLNIRKTIEKHGFIGDCDFCSSKNSYVIDISDPDNSLSEKINSVIQVYALSDSSYAKPLKQSLHDDWDIFSGGVEVIQTLVLNLCSHEFGEDNDIFYKNVYIPNLYDEEFIRNDAVVGGLTWSEFSDSIKYENRFHNNKFNKDVFATYLTLVVKAYHTGDCFYRARIADNADGHISNNMSTPPKGKRSAGRVNPEGIGVLYLSLEQETVLNETRVNVYDYVTIGKFRAKRDLRVVNLSGLLKISPFDYGYDLERFALNRNIFRELSKEIAKPLRRSDSVLEYLPTQFISEFVKSEGYDGVEFESTLRNGGHNLALFDEKAVECFEVNTIEIKNIDYSFVDSK